MADVSLEWQDDFQPDSTGDLMVVKTVSGKPFPQFWGSTFRPGSKSRGFHFARDDRACRA